MKSTIRCVLAWAGLAIAWAGFTVLNKLTEPWIVRKRGA